jgi:hypothetical protein
VVNTSAAYTYDALDRLTTEQVTTNDSTSPGYTATYTLDLVGNRTDEAHTTATESLGRAGC